ncbi:MAG UNVERIFIED_CONTAM: hypothetical protein LVR18_42320 [Planctomycetaceae bacterium]
MLDFISGCGDGLQALVAELDHSVLLPDRHRQIKWNDPRTVLEVTARFENRRWLFPRRRTVEFYPWKIRPPN